MGSLDRPALIEDGASWTYRQLLQSIEEIAEALDSLGIRPGDRMIIVSENSIALAGLLLAAQLVSAVRWQVLARKKIEEVDVLLARAQRMKTLLAHVLECRCVRLEDCAAIIGRKGDAA